MDLVELSPATLVLPRHSSKGPLYTAQSICRTQNNERVALVAEDVPDGLTVTIIPAPNLDNSQLIRVEWKPEGSGSEGNARKTVRLRATVGGQSRVVSLPIICGP